MSIMWPFTEFWVFRFDSIFKFGIMDFNFLSPLFALNHGCYAYG